jgi:hypothetical protein
LGSCLRWQEDRPNMHRTLRTKGLWGGVSAA